MTRPRTLMLLRHAKAVSAVPGSADVVDHARALSPRGRADAQALGRQLRSRGQTPDLVLVSSARRTRETFDLLGLDATVPRIVSEAMYLADESSLLELVREQDDAAGSLMLVGHNPGLHALAFDLAHPDEALARGFPTCALALFDIEAPWAALAPPVAVLRWFWQPGNAEP